MPDTVNPKQSLGDAAAREYQAAKADENSGKDTMTEYARSVVRVGTTQANKIYRVHGDATHDGTSQAGK